MQFCSLIIALLSFWFNPTLSRLAPGAQACVIVDCLPDGQHLFINETFACRISRYDVAADGAGRRWQALIDGATPTLLRTMTEDSESAAALRRESPFTVLVDKRDRARVFERLRAG